MCLEKLALMKLCEVKLYSSTGATATNVINFGADKGRFGILLCAPNTGNLELRDPRSADVNIYIYRATTSIAEPIFFNLWDHGPVVQRMLNVYATGTNAKWAAYEYTLPDDLEQIRKMIKAYP